MADFKIGDVVEVLDGAPYTLSVGGSYGTVTEIRDDFIVVDFQFTPSGQMDVWSIRKEWLKLRGIEVKEILVARKIATIYSRQRARGIAHV